MQERCHDASGLAWRPPEGGAPAASPSLPVSALLPPAPPLLQRICGPDGSGLEPGGAKRRQRDERDQERGGGGGEARDRDGGRRDDYPPRCGDGGREREREGKREHDGRCDDGGGGKRRRHGFADADTVTSLRMAFTIGAREASHRVYLPLGDAAEGALISSLVCRCMAPAAASSAAPTRRRAPCSMLASSAAPGPPHAHAPAPSILPSLLVAPCIAAAFPLQALPTAWLAACPCTTGTARWGRRRH